MAHIESIRRGRSRRPALSLCALAAGLLMSASPALAEQPARIKEMSFTTQAVYNQEIRVISTDKMKWNKIASNSFSFGAHVNIDTRHPGYVRHVGIVLGNCGGGGACTGKPLLWIRSPVHRDYENQMAVTFPTSKIPVSGPGIATVPFGDQIVAYCNTKLTAHGGETHSFNKAMPVTFVADTFKDIGYVLNTFIDNGPLPAQWHHQTDHAKMANVNVTVKCEGFQNEIAKNVPDDPSYKATDAKVFLSTFQNQNTNPAPGVVCEKGRVLARIVTTKEGPVKFNLWTKVGTEPMEKKFIEAWSSRHGSEYKAEHVKWVSVSKSTSVKAMVEDITNPISNTSGWKDMPLHCSSPGGGWATVPKANSEAPTKQQAQGKLNRPPVIVTPAPEKPQTRPTERPTIKVAPVRKIVCIGGKVRSERCSCPRPFAAKPIGANRYRCQRTIVDPVPQQPPAFQRPHRRPVARPRFDRPRFDRPQFNRRDARPAFRGNRSSGIGGRRFMR